jgi:hypothetical protein
MSGPYVIMITGDQMLVAVESGNSLEDSRSRTHPDIPEMPDLIPRADDLVPLLDQMLVVFFDCFERSPTFTFGGHSFVAEVGIGCEPDFSHSNVNFPPTHI